MVSVLPSAGLPAFASLDIDYKAAWNAQSSTISTVSVANADAIHAHDAAQCIEHRADDTTMQAVVLEMPHQVVSHVDAGRDGFAAKVGEFES